MSSVRICRAERGAAIGLGTLRRLLGFSQNTLAERLHVTQPNVAKLEAQQDMHLASLRRYVEALGGELELHVRVGKVRLSLDLDAHAGLRKKEFSMSQQGDQHATEEHASA